MHLLQTQRNIYPSRCRGIYFVICVVVVFVVVVVVAVVVVVVVVAVVVIVFVFVAASVCVSITQVENRGKINGHTPPRLRIVKTLHEKQRKSMCKYTMYVRGASERRFAKMIAHICTQKIGHTKIDRPYMFSHTIIQLLHMLGHMNIVVPQIFSHTNERITAYCRSYVNRITTFIHFHPYVRILWLYQKHTTTITYMIICICMSTKSW